jgi:hypothetical protein
MTLNDQKLSEFYIDAHKQLRDVNENERAGTLEAVRQAWENLQAICLRAGYRCNDIRYGKVRHEA